ncbi:MAG: hypothetical protein LR015_11910 [Verrucomicrobia bacterium]|nr:hypothetical protein [Verrucomicrobiota bacterium]
MHKPFTSFLIVVATLCLVSGAHASDSIEGQLDRFKSSVEAQIPGKISLNLRVRYEEFQTPTVDRNGVSARLRYGYTTPEASGLSAMIEGETLWALSSAHRIHPLDEQGRGTELNQLLVRWRDPAHGSVTLGRQIYVLDNQRFIGHVGWRQNIQTFDALATSFTGWSDLALNAFYIGKVHRVNGTSESLDGYGLNLRYQPRPEISLTGFAYLLDFERQTAWSANTFRGSREWEHCPE